jgi:predicted nucleotidyltransferase
LLEKYKNQIISVLENKESIVFAYLFGSSATKTSTPMSDIDIAIYLNPNINK